MAITAQTEQEKAVELLGAKIRVAFPDSAFWGPITGVDGLHNEELDEQQALYRGLRGRKWSEISASIIETYPDGITLLTDEAFVAYLPAWLSSALTHEKVRELVVYSFSPDVHKSTERMDYRIINLSSPQKEALLAFLTYCFEVESSKFVKDHAQSAVAHAARLICQSGAENES